MKTWLKSRASEASTWRGLIMLVCSLSGWQTSPDSTEAWVLVATTLSGLVGVGSSDKK
jgi:hypothetical protein